MLYFNFNLIRKWYAIEVSVLWMARAHCIHFSLWPKYMRKVKILRDQHEGHLVLKHFDMKLYYFLFHKRSSSYSYKVTLSHFSLLISSLFHMQRENINVHQLQFKVSKFKLGIYGWDLCSSCGMDRNQFPFSNLVSVWFLLGS